MKKGFKFLFQLITGLILIFAVFVMVFTIFTVNKEDASFFGYKPYIVLTDSMKGEFEVGDIIVSRKIDANDLKEGDIITFVSIDPVNYGEVVSHKIRCATTYDGKKAYITYGIATGSDDAYPALAENVKGIYAFKLSKMGYFFEFLKTPLGYFLLIFIPFLILILSQGINFIYLLNRYKKEMNDEYKRQKKELIEERKRIEELIEKLEELRKETAQKQKKGSDDVKKNMKTGLTISMLSLLVVCMIYSLTTYAFFTDSIRNTGSRIQVGTLEARVELIKDIDLGVNDENLLYVLNMPKDNNFDYAEAVNFRDGINTNVFYIKISNIGSIDFQFGFSAENESCLFKVTEVSDSESIISKDEKDILKAGLSRIYRVDSSQEINAIDFVFKIAFEANDSVKIMQSDEVYFEDTDRIDDALDSGGIIEEKNDAASDFSDEIISSDEEDKSDEDIGIQDSDKPKEQPDDEMVEDESKETDTEEPDLPIENGKDEQGK